MAEDTRTSYENLIREARNEYEAPEVSEVTAEEPEEVLVKEIKQFPDGETYEFTSEFNRDIGDTSWAWVDSDTFVDKATGDKVRLDRIDLREVSKLLQARGYIPGDFGGNDTFKYVMDLARRYGFTEVRKNSSKKDQHGRYLGDLYDSEGNSFQSLLLSSGIATPGYIGKSNIKTSEKDYDRYIAGQVLADISDDTTPLALAEREIHNLVTGPSGGIPFHKLQAFNEAEYASDPDLYSSILIRNSDATLENKAIHPISLSWDAAWLGIGKAFNEVGVKLSNTAGFEDLESYFKANSTLIGQELARNPDILLDYRDVDWKSFDDVTEYLGSNVAMSLPYMGITAASFLLAGPTMGLSLAVPSLMYTGQILDEMQGPVEDKSGVIALGGGIIAASLDRLGFRGILGPTQLLGKKGRERAIALIKEAKNVSTEKAEAILFSASKFELASMVREGSRFASAQITKANLLRQTALSMSRSGAIEGATETLQELTQYTASVIGSDKIWDWEELEGRLANAAIAGSMLGAGFSLPNTAFQAAEWKDASVRVNPDDKRYADSLSRFRTENETKYGKSPTLDRAAAGVRNTVFELKVVGQDSQGNPILKKVIPTEADVRLQAHEQAKKDKGTAKRLREALAKPQTAFREWIGSAIPIVTRQVSASARYLYDMMDGRHNNTLGGVSYQGKKNGLFNYYKSLVPNNTKVFESFGFKGSTGSIGRQVGNILYSFHSDVITTKTFRYIQKNGKDTKKRDDSRWKSWSKIESEIDWENLPERYQKHSGAIRDTLRSFYKMTDEMLAETNRVRASNKQKNIGDVQDWTLRHKSFLKKEIVKHRDKFTELLISSYKIKPADAVALVNEIIQNEEVNTLEEAFNIVKGGLHPSSYKKRSLGLADNPAFAEFMEQNFIKNMEDAMKASARTQAYQHFIGPDAIYLRQIVDDIESDLRGSESPDSERGRKATEEANRIFSDIQDILNADSGNYKRIENDTMRGLQKNMTLWTALAALPLSPISSLVEMAMIPRGVSKTVLKKSFLDISFQGRLLGQEMHNWFTSMGKILRVAEHKSPDTQINSRSSNDPRHMFFDNPREFAERIGFFSQETGAAITTGVTETSEVTRVIMDSFFKVIGLQNYTNYTRVSRLAMFNDFFTDSIDTIVRNEGKPDTIAVAEARKMLIEVGIPVQQMINLSKEIFRVGGIDKLTPEERRVWEDNFFGAGYNFVNLAIPMPSAASRPSFYSNPHFALLTQFQGFISQFTAVHLPKIYQEIKVNGGATPGMKYSVFASMATMLMLGYASQYLKDLLKYGKGSPFLNDNEKWLRAIYSTGLLGTSERVISSNFILPLYEQKQYSAINSVWVNVSGEAAATSILEDAFKSVKYAFEGDSEKAYKFGLKATPIFRPFHRWVTGEN